MSNSAWPTVLLVSYICLAVTGCNDNERLLQKQLTQINEKLDALNSQFSATTVLDKAASASASDITLTELHTASEAKELIQKLGKQPTASKLAEALNAIDSWSVKPDQESDMLQFKLEIITQLRKRVIEEVTSLQKAALEADSGKNGAKKHIEAGTILALYPMSEEKSVIEEAKQLSAQQADVAVRLEVIRRQRYNHWAAEQVEKAIANYNNTKSSIPFNTDRNKLVADLVNDMGPVDPAQLEPMVVELYNYAVNLTKDALTEAEKTDLAKKMTDPNIKRKTLGDF